MERFDFDDNPTTRIEDWDIDYLLFSGWVSDIFSKSNTLLNQFMGTIYKKPLSKILYSKNVKKPIQTIGNLGLKYGFGFQEDCGFPLREELKNSDLRNIHFTAVAAFMIEKFPNRKIYVFAHGQKDSGIQFEQINQLFLKYGHVEVALAAHIKSEDKGFKI